MSIVHSCLISSTCTCGMASSAARWSVRGRPRLGGGRRFGRLRNLRLHLSGALQGQACQLTGWNYQPPLLICLSRFGEDLVRPTTAQASKRSFYQALFLAASRCSCDLRPTLKFSVDLWIEIHSQGKIKSALIESYDSRILRTVHCPNYYEWSGSICCPHRVSRSICSILGCRNIHGTYPRRSI